MVTLYTYDTLDNLTCVEQHGTATGQTGCSSSPSNDSSSAWRIRRFTYDSLGRLVTATNPESGAISYTYDSDGNVLTKYDARGITTTMTYDQLHRVLTKTYSDGTPTATYIYDVAATDGPGSSANPVGRLVEVKNSNAKEVDSYDTRGRINAQWQCTPLNCGSSWFNLGYSYNYAGGLISESTPMGFTLTPAYDPAARLKSLTSSWSDAQHPANLLTVDPTAGYTPAGALAKMTYGNGLIELSAYNNRLQPTQLRTYNPTTSTDVLNLNYGFTNSAGANNGNVVTFNSTATQIFMRTYTYDELNRLSTMSSPADASGCYGLTWTYDAWGNRLSQNPAGGSGSACVGSQPTIYTNNRIIDPGYVHDTAGNMTHDASHGYTFNAESELTQVDSGSTATYVYDAIGQRVRKTASGVTTDYVRDASAHVVAEIQGSTWTKGYVYVGPLLLSQYDGLLGSSGATTLFVHTDHLGTTRLLSTSAASVSDSMDYLPYGELLSGGSSTTHKFTGKERDAESGLDNFGARYNSSNIGRFISPDPKAPNLKHLTNPQKWNKYAYTLDNPLRYFDPNGEEEIEVQLRSYIPQANQGPYKGDDRGPTTSQNVTSRTSISVRVETDPSKAPKPELHNSGGQAGQTENLLTGSKDTQTKGLPMAKVSRDDKTGNVVINITQNAKNPLGPEAVTPGIKSDLTITISKDGSSVTTAGTVSGSPAFELNITTQGGTQINVPLQGASSNPAAFVAGLTQTNSILTSTPLPPPPPPCADKGGSCSQ